MEDKLLGATATPTAVGPDDTADPGQSLFDAAGADFGLALLGQLLQQQPGSSIVVSPFSVACVLAFVHAGARGCTAEQLAGLLAGSAQAPAADVQRRFGAALRRLLAKEAAQLEQQQRFRQMQQLEQLDQGPQWCASNRVFVDGRVLTLSAAYLTLLQVHYGDDSSGLIQTIDFDAAEEAAQMINRFVEETTRGRIRDLVSADMLQPRGADEFVGMVLVNAVYFLGTWEKPFKSDNTKALPFYVGSGKQPPPLSLQTMCMTDYLAYFENDLVQVLRLFYRPTLSGHLFSSGGWTAADPRWSMVLVLPRQRFGLGALLATGTGVSGRQLLLDWTRRCQSARVRVHLPKFRIESTHDLVEPLKALGITDVFDPQLADLSGIVNQGKPSLWVSKVVQKAFIVVDEIGTEAAAATAAVLLGCSLSSLPPPPPIPFVADQPFLWALCGPDGGGGSESSGASGGTTPLFTGIFGGQGGEKSDGGISRFFKCCTTNQQQHE